MALASFTIAKVFPFTIRQLGVTALARFDRPLMLPLELVNAVGLLAQLTLN